MDLYGFSIQIATDINAPAPKHSPPHARMQMGFRRIRRAGAIMRETNIEKCKREINTKE